MTKFLNIKQVAKRTRLSVAAIQGWIDVGLFPGAIKIKVQGVQRKMWHIPVDEVVTFNQQWQPVLRSVVRQARVKIYMIDGHEYVSAPDAAKLLGITRQAVHLRLQSGSLIQVKYATQWGTTKNVLRIDCLLTPC